MLGFIEDFLGKRLLGVVTFVLYQFPGGF